MMLHADMHVSYISHVHGRTIGHRARICYLPFIPPHSNHDLKLVFLAIPEDPMLLCILAKTLVKTTACRLRGHPCIVCPKKTKCFKKPRKKLEDQEIQDTTIKKLPSYLVPAFFAAINVGCHIEAYLCKFMRPLQRAPWFLALQSAFLNNPVVQFDSDSFCIGIDNHALQCMANAPHLFEDLQLTDNVEEVKGIGNGLAIEGKGMFKFSLEEDQGKILTIKIPNSLYLPELKQCLLSPQHWAQEAGDGQTWMGNFKESVCCIGTGEARKQSSLIHQGTRQSSPRLCCPTLIARSP
jgi:hypothetical protein